MLNYIHVKFNSKKIELNIIIMFKQMTSTQTLFTRHYMIGSCVRVNEIRGEKIMWLVDIDDQWAHSYTRQVYGSYQDADDRFKIADIKFCRQCDEYLEEARASLPQNHLEWLDDNCKGEGSP